MCPTKQIAENRTTISHALFNEGMRAVESKTYKKSVRKFVLILATLYLAVAVYLLCTNGSLSFLLGESVFLAALLFWLLVMFPASRRRSKYKAMTPNTGSCPERTTIFHQNHLTVMTDTGKETEISYDDILNWQETKNLYILNCKNNLGILLDKKGFVAGDFQIVKSTLWGR